MQMVVYLHYINVDWIKWMYFCVDKFEVSINDGIFSGNEQQKVHLKLDYRDYTTIVITTII